MPRGDGTGPLGLGPMTGRAAGYCAGYPVPGFANPWGGYRFWGRGGGLGFGRGFGYLAVPGFANPWVGRRFWGRGRGRGFGRVFGYFAPAAPVYPVHGTPLVYP
jgi:hypothetical protein